MKQIYCLLTATVLTAVSLVSCSKSNSVDQQKRAEEFKASMVTHGYKPVAFYADKPVDYLNNGGSDTDLWKYVKEYIKDDIYVFGADGTAIIYQNAKKVNWSDSDTLHVKYSIEAKDNSVYINYVNYDYFPATYRLESFDNTQMIFYVDGPNGSKLYSKYTRVN